MRQNRLGMMLVPAAAITVVVMLVIPIPTYILDALISLNITFAIVVLLLSMHVTRPLDFSSFPTLLLLATLFRLALNVSATRLVLLHAYAGTVIQSFGHFVVGQSIVVGLVIFLIIIIIQFVVINNGAGRVAEVAARFTLDAMPGKQMAIDADLNSGLIDGEEALRRRKAISDEADFYGAMDGASKFVRGDAVAAVVIVLVNLIGGFIVGVIQHHMSFTKAVDTYSLLSVGDGLVSQLPALLLSISTGIVVTRAGGQDDDFGSQLVGQLANQHRAVRMAGAAIALVGLFPGLPHLAFIIVGTAVYLMGRRARSTADRLAAAKAEAEALGPPPAAELTPATLASDMRVDALELELAFDLVDLVDATRGGDLLERVRGLRRKIARDLGIVIPPVRTRDNIDLPAGTYTIRLHGVEVARGEAPPGKALAIGQGIDDLPGEPTTDPVFGLPARWIPDELRHLATTVGVTVVDRSSLLTTHLGEIVARNAGGLVSRQQVRALIDVAKETDPVVVEELGNAQVGLAEVQQVLCALLDEGVSIRDLVRILEALTERARTSKDFDSLLEAARLALGPAICTRYTGEAGRLPVITIEASLEQSLVDSLRPGENGLMLAIDPATAERLIAETGRLAMSSEQQGDTPVIVCNGRLRPALRRLLATALPRLGVLAVGELGPQVVPDRIGVVSFASAPV